MSSQQIQATFRSNRPNLIAVFRDPLDNGFVKMKQNLEKWKNFKEQTIAPIFLVVVLAAKTIYKTQFYFEANVKLSILTGGFFSRRISLYQDQKYGSYLNEQ